MLLKFNAIGVKVIHFSLMCGLLCGGVLPLAWGANISPVNQNTVVNQAIDRMALPEKIFIWNNVFGGSSDGCDGSKLDCKNNDMFNSLLCMSDTGVSTGACPSKLFWGSLGSNAQLTLRFTHSQGQTKELKVTSIKELTEFPSWEPAMPLADKGFTTFIPSSELNKLSIAGVWRAKLTMKVSAWDNCPDTVNGCWGMYRALWSADITLTVRDDSNQQIYLPAFPTSNPVINLNLNTRPGASSGNSVSGRTSLDMCLYDGNDSASNRISLLLRDEGATAAGRPAGQFSIYRRGGDKSKASDRLDYQVSVINPTTGAAQQLANGSEITWSDTNRRNIQRLVILPGVSTPALCVPAPLTLTTPAFSMADKTAGDYTGTLRIIYTPSTQT